jgi:hypothetical protein
MGIKPDCLYNKPVLCPLIFETLPSLWSSPTVNLSPIANRNANAINADESAVLSVFEKPLQVIGFVVKSGRVRKHFGIVLKRYSVDCNALHGGFC